MRVDGEWRALWDVGWHANGVELACQVVGHHPDRHPARCLRLERALPQELVRGQACAVGVMRRRCMCVMMGGGRGLLSGGEQAAGFPARSIAPLDATENTPLTCLHWAWGRVEDGRVSKKVRYGLEATKIRSELEAILWMERSMAEPRRCTISPSCGSPSNVAPEIDFEQPCDS